MTDTKKKVYGIDIVSPSGELISQAVQAKHSNNIEVVPTETVRAAEELGEITVETAEKEYVEPLLAKKRRSMGIRAKRVIGNSVIYVILIAMSIVWLIPFIFIVLESFRCDLVPGTESQITWMTGKVWPETWGFTNYKNLFKDCFDAAGNFKGIYGFPRWFLNTFIMGVAVAIIQTVIVLSMSYTLSRIRFKGRKALMNFMLILGMFPGFLTLILLYKLLSMLGLTENMSVVGLILVYTASSGMGYYVSKGFFDTIPKSLDEAARVDGATRAQVFTKVILPMAKPIVIYTILMGFMAPWGDFMLASYIAHSANNGFNVAVGLQNMIGSPASLTAHYTEFCAGGVLVALPITILFMCLQKYYVEGVTGGAVKG